MSDDVEVTKLQSIHLMGRTLTLCGEPMSDLGMNLLRPYAAGADGPDICPLCLAARGPLPEMWICDRCETIGLHASALAHEIAFGHPIEKIADDMAEALRHAWAAQVRSLIDGDQL